MEIGVAFLFVNNELFYLMSVEIDRGLPEFHCILAQF